MLKTTVATPFLIAELAPAASLPVVVESRRTVLDVLETFRGAPDRAQPRESPGRFLARQGLLVVGTVLGAAGIISAAVGVGAALGLPVPMDLMSGSAATNVGVGVSLLGSSFIMSAPHKRTNAAQLATQQTLEVARSLPLPASNASRVERAVAGWLATWATRESTHLSVGQHAKDYESRAGSLLDEVGERNANAIGEILECLYDKNGRPLERLNEIDVLTACIEQLEPELRAELVAYLGPQIESIRPRERSWRNDALTAAMEGRQFRYGKLVSSDARAPALGTPDDVRLRALDTKLEKRLAESAERGGALFAQVSVPGEVSNDQAFRLAGKYEDLGYRACLHPANYGIRLTLTTRDRAPSAAAVEQRTHVTVPDPG